MEPPREELLARSALAEDEDGRREARDFLHRIEHVPQRGAGTGHELAPIQVVDFVLERQHTAVQVLPLAGVPDEDPHGVGSGRLRDEVIRAELDGPDRFVHIRLARGQDDLDERIVFSDDLQQLEAADAREGRLGDDQVHFLAIHHREGRLAGRRAQDAIVAAERHGNRLPGPVFLIHDDDGLAARGHWGEYNGLGGGRRKGAVHRLPPPPDSCLVPRCLSSLLSSRSSSPWWR